MADVEKIVARFELICRTQPQRPLVALPSLRTTMTAADIWQQHHDYLAHLSRLDLHPGDLVVCGIGNRPELLPVLLACRVMDLTLMALDTGATAAEIRSLCVRFGARALLTSAPVVPGDGAAATVAPGLTLLRCEGRAIGYPGAAMLKLTSGSSGLPRATRMTETQLIADGSQIMAAMAIGPDDTQLAVIPLAHSYGLGVIVMPLLLQGTGIILRESFVPPHLPADAREFGARRLPGVPFMFEHLIEHPPAGGWPDGLTKLVSAGARLSPSTVRAFHDKFGIKVHPFYGTTETGGISYDDSENAEAATTVGRPLGGVSVTLEPMSGLPPELGRVHVRSGAVSDGYVGADPGDFTKGGFLTGDYGTVGDDGRLTLMGRISSFINVAGRKVQPDEVEAVLLSMPDIVDARVVGAVDAHRGQQVVACIVPRDGVPAPGPLQIREFCSPRLAAHKLPRTVIVVPSIPLNARGKTDRAALEALVRRHIEGRP